jgi:hypothetical protein
MKIANAARNETRRFVAVYGFGDQRRRAGQELTVPRESIEAVMADLADKQEREGKLCVVQIIDLSTLELIEPYQATLARLRRAALI